MLRLWLSTGRQYALGAIFEPWKYQDIGNPTALAIAIRALLRHRRFILVQNERDAAQRHGARRVPRKPTRRVDLTRASHPRRRASGHKVEVAAELFSVNALAQQPARHRVSGAAIARYSAVSFGLGEELGGCVWPKACDPIDVVGPIKCVCRSGLDSCKVIHGSRAGLPAGLTATAVSACAWRRRKHLSA